MQCDFSACDYAIDHYRDKIHMLHSHSFTCTRVRTSHSAHRPTDVIRIMVGDGQSNTKWMYLFLLIDFHRVFLWQWEGREHIDKSKSPWTEADVMRNAHTEWQNEPKFFHFRCDSKMVTSFTWRAHNQNESTSKSDFCTENDLTTAHTTTKLPTIKIPYAVAPFGMAKARQLALKQWGVCDGHIILQ